MKKLELGWGNAGFLSPYWEGVNLSIHLEDIRNHIHSPSSYQWGHIPQLESVIRALHKVEKNAITEDKHMVVGNGASHLLVAILHVLGKPATAKAPYFMRFPKFAEAAGVDWNASLRGVEILTTPNNPDGTVITQEPVNYLKSTLVYDLSYNWLQYATPVNYDKDIMVFSLSKATGHASTRIGWALFKDEALAKRVRDYIETSTCGMSIEAQWKALKVIEHNLYKGDETCFRWGKNVLDRQWNTIKSTNLPFEVANNSGMFLWFKMDNHEEYFKEKEISYIKGEVFGSSSEYARVNIGCSEQDFEEFIERIRT